jgi:hypothetical protein
MPLSPGDKIGPYEIVAPLSAGGPVARTPASGSNAKRAPSPA